MNKDKNEVINPMVGFYEVSHNPRKGLPFMAKFFVWLTMAQANGYTDSNEMVTAYEEWNCEMIPCELKLGDLKIIGLA